MLLIADTESNGLKFEATRMWCGVALEPLTATMWYSVENEYFDSTDIEVVDELKDLTVYKVTNREYVQLLSLADTVVFHNGYMHDLPLLKKLYPGFTIKNLEDTFVLSSLFNPDRPSPKGWVGKPKPHSIEAWGMRLGFKKPEQEQWKVFEPKMLTRCAIDVIIGHKTWEELQKERKSWDWESAIDLEYKCAYLQGIQEMTGVVFDLQRANELVKKLDEEIAELDKELYKLLPIRCVNGGEVKKPFKKNGGLNANVAKWLENDL